LNAQLEPARRPLALKSLPFTTQVATQARGDIIAEALSHPVTITQRNKPAPRAAFIARRKSLTEISRIR
jgi:hypothetical protein